MRSLVLLFCAVLVMANAGSAAIAAPKDSADVAPSSDVSRTYLLSSGDKLKVTVFSVASLSGEYAISAGGDIAMPLIGDVKAAGKTVDVLANTIRDALAQGFVNDPKVSIEIINYSPFFILGEVNKPGQFPFLSNLTVEQAVATAGGYTYRAARRKAFLRRSGGPEQLVRFGRDPVYVLPGDTIRIGERYF